MDLLQAMKERHSVRSYKKNQSKPGLWKSSGPLSKNAIKKAAFICSLS